MRPVELIVEPRLKQLIVANFEDFKDIFEDECMPQYEINGTAFARAMKLFFDDKELFDYIFFVQKHHITQELYPHTEILENLLYRQTYTPEQLTLNSAVVFAFDRLDIEQIHSLVKKHLQSEQYGHNINLVSSHIRNEVKDIINRNDLYEHFLHEIDNISEDTTRLIIASDISYDFNFHTSIVQRTSELVKQISKSELTTEEKNSLLILIEDIAKSELN